ncbi:hypothetical protein GGR54DRAFT_654017 [Hypoxylon sp. NC1633]|nr:hypothetical protein GGR54DRAFT_654017 [Hypoxylon sp. NC1633]
MWRPGSGNLVVTGRDGAVARELNSGKRQATQLPTPPPAKRQKGSIEVIELSDDDAVVAGDFDHSNDEDADEKGARQLIEDFGRQFAKRIVSAEDWKNVCRMFQCQEDITEHQPIGFKVALSVSGYQLHAIWWQISQFPVKGVPGGCLGDEMGLGKTFEVLSVFMIFALVKMNYRETYLIATVLPSLPIICFASPSSLDGWRREFEKLVDLNNPIMKNLKLSIVHSDFKEDETYYHSSERVRATIAKAVNCHINNREQPDCYLTGREGLINWFLLITSGLSSPQGWKYGRHTSKFEGKTFTTNGLAASFAFFTRRRQLRE